MGKKTKILLLVGPSVFGFVMSLTTPLVSLYFMKLVDSQVYAFAGVLYTGIAALTQSIMANEDARNKLKRVFVGILIADSLLFIIVSNIGIENVTFRFIGLEILSATSVSVWMMIMQDAVNNVLNGPKLTDYQSLNRAVFLWANLAGGLLAIFLVDSMNINVAVNLQCVANCFCAATDYAAFKKLA